jgi:hypothetical protein
MAGPATGRVDKTVNQRTVSPAFKRTQSEKEIHMHTVGLIEMNQLEL